MAELNSQNKKVPAIMVEISEKSAREMGKVLKKIKAGQSIKFDFINQVFLFRIKAEMPKE